MQISIKMLTGVMLAIVMGCAAVGKPDASDTVPVDLKTEALVEPVMLDTTRARFSWRLDTLRPGAKQSAWQIQVATTALDIEN